MKSTDLQIPEFAQPDAENLFLASKNGLRTYAELFLFSDFFLQFLIDFDHDLKKPVGFIASSSDELIFCIAACWQLGIPFICFNPKATAAELQGQIDELEPGIILTDRDHSDQDFVENQVSISEVRLERALSIEVELGRRAKTYKPLTKPDDIFGYFFTSGTTGNPKIVPLKRRQMLFAAHASAENFRPRVNHFWLLCLPLNHIGGISIILRSILYGSGIYRLDEFNIDAVSTFLSENTMFQAASLVPTMLKRLLDIKGFQTHKNFQAILLGGGPMDSNLLKEATEWGIPVVASYGMTETCAQIAANPLLKPSGTYRPSKSVGNIFEPNRIQIRDDQNKDIGVNNSGVIWLKGPQVFDGYFKKQKPNLSFDEDGWFNTGDYGHLNANGHLFIESRRTDLIITGGENVSPHEVEAELEKIEPISEAAVFGVDDKEWGQKVVAVVVAKTHDLLETESIQKTLKKRITSYKVPKQIVQAETLPRTHSGKVIREELLKLFKGK